ncbi:MULTISPECIES: DUF3841 domain-containing protein [unclassified Sedimentibacter]|uniref:DUF3841 domain-containing protein n=1 Tax=unclassified Sedimentibacter TaxID=2649220 RepID=UPI0027DF3550|nr:DUF3841 domain-containing protein [Sedimentibacter sp. MB35-C1]WMJ76328.1 DUF3841 domain-containing protein [Sedimentibacter sp. MB35-C1]
MENNSDKVTLWSRQHIKSLKELENNGVIRITHSHLEEKFDEIAGYIINLYKWFVSAAEERVTKPDDVEFPIWCSISEENMLRPVKDQIVYVLEVDRSDIIYFDGLKWDYVLNHHYIPKDQKDAEEYAKEMELKGFENSYSFINDRTAHFYPAEKKRVMDSWYRIFEIENWDIFRVQANIWEIRPEMIKEILYK